MQATLFDWADVIVSPHGAAFGNIAFMAVQSVVVHVSANEGTITFNPMGHIYVDFLVQNQKVEDYDGCLVLNLEVVQVTGLGMTTWCTYMMQCSTCLPSMSNHPPKEVLI